MHFSNEPIEKGNVLFLILIAVALFAALSYAVTQSTRSGGGDASAEKLQLTSSEWIQFAGQLQQTVQRMLLTGGCDMSEISFDTTPGTGGEENPTAPTDLSCHVFSPLGGGVPAPQEQHSSPTVPGWLSTNNLIVEGMGIDTAGTPCPGCELAYIYYHVPQDLCATLNKKLLGSDTVHDYGPGALGPPAAYNGTFSVGSSFYITAANTGTSSHISQPNFCIKETGGQNTWVFVNVLQPR